MEKWMYFLMTLLLTVVFHWQGSIDGNTFSALLILNNMVLGIVSCLQEEKNGKS